MSLSKADKALVKRNLSALMASRGERAGYRFVAALFEIILRLSPNLVELDPNGEGVSSRPDLLVFRGEEELRTAYLVGEGKTRLATPEDVRAAYVSKKKYFTDFPEHEYFLLWDSEQLYVWRHGANFENPMAVVLWSDADEVCRVIASLLPANQDLGAFHFHGARNEIVKSLSKSLSGETLDDEAKELALNYLLAAIWVVVFEGKFRPSLSSSLALSDWGLKGKRFDTLTKILGESPTVQRAFEQCIEKGIPKIFEWDPCVRSLGLNPEKYTDVQRVLELEPARARLREGLVDPFCGPGALLSFVISRYLKEEVARGAMSANTSLGAVDELKAVLQRTHGSDPNPEHIILTKILILQEVRRYLQPNLFVLRDMLAILKETVVCTSDPLYAQARTLVTILPDRTVSRSGKSDFDRQGMANQSVVIATKLANVSNSREHIIHLRRSFLGTSVTGSRARKLLQPRVSGRTSGGGLNSLTIWWSNEHPPTEPPVVLFPQRKATIDRSHILRMDLSPLPQEVFDSFYVDPGSKHRSNFAQPYVSYEPGPVASKLIRDEPEEGHHPQYSSGDSPLFGFDPKSARYVHFSLFGKKSKKKKRKKPTWSPCEEEVRAKIYTYGLVEGFNELGFRNGSGDTLGILPESMHKSQRRGRSSFAIPIDPQSHFVFARTRNPCVVVTPHPQGLVNNEYLTVARSEPYPLHMLAQSRISQILFRLNSSSSKWSNGRPNYTWTKESFAWIPEGVVAISAELMEIGRRFEQALHPLKQLAESPRVSIRDFDMALVFTGIEERVGKRSEIADGRLNIRTVSGKVADVTGSEASLRVIQLALSMQTSSLPLGDLMVRQVPAQFEVNYRRLKAECLRATAAIRDDLDILVSGVLGISDENRKKMLEEYDLDEECYGLIPTWWGLPSL